LSPEASHARRHFPQKSARQPELGQILRIYHACKYVAGTLHWQSTAQFNHSKSGDEKNWQPDIKFETATFPAGGVAPSTYALARHYYIQRARAWLRRG